MRRKQFPGWGLSDDTIENLGYKLYGHRKCMIELEPAPYLGEPNPNIKVGPRCFELSPEVRELLEKSFDEALERSSEAAEKSRQKTIGVRVVKEENK